MRSQISRFAVVSAGVLGLVLASAGGTVAQQLKFKTLKDNPYRDPGGACVYGRDGALIHAPVGVECPDREDHFRSARTEAPAAVLEGFPPAVRNSVSQLYRDHSHISDEIARVRTALDAGNGSAARAALDKLAGEVTDHRSREEALFEQISSQRTAR